MGRHAISQSIRAVLAAKRARGEFYGHAPFGFRAEAGRLVEDPREQRILRAIEELRALPLQAVCIELARRGLRSRRGGELGPSAVSRLRARRPSGDAA